MSLGVSAKVLKFLEAPLPTTQKATPPMNGEAEVVPLPVAGESCPSKTIHAGVGRRDVACSPVWQLRDEALYPQDAGPGEECNERPVDFCPAKRKKSVSKLRDWFVQLKKSLG